MTMRYASIKAVILISVGILGSCLYFAACGCDGPLEPKLAKDYPAYFLDAIQDEANWYFAYHPATNTVDSFWLPYYHEPVISADGKKMYVWDWQQRATAVLTVDSMMVIGQLPLGFPLAVSPDNRLIAIYDDGLTIFNTSDYSVVFHDTVLPGPGGAVFSANSRRYYGTPEAGGVYILDLSDPLFPVTRLSVPFGWVFDLAPSPDETRLFLYLQRPVGFGAFAVHDLAADSLIFIDTLFSGYGELEPTPNGRYVFYTNPGGPHYPGSSPWITVYDVERNAVHTTISTVGVLEHPYEYGIPLSEICISPDGRYLTALGWSFVLCLDIRRMAFVNYLKLRGPNNLLGLVCQNSL